MNLLWIYLAAVAGGIMGFLVCALISINRERIYHLDGVIRWIMKEGGDIDKTMKEIVRRVYDGRKHLSYNPVKGRCKNGYVTDVLQDPEAADSGYRVPVPSAEEISL